VIVLRALRGLLLLVVFVLRAILQVACSLVSCWLPLIVVALVAFAIYRATHG
jgi:hypothetical protein